MFKPSHVRHYAQRTANARRSLELEQYYPLSCGDNRYAPDVAVAKLSLDDNILKQNQVKVSEKSACGRRQNMEDRHTVVKDIVSGTHFLGIYDGHGGAEVAAGCKDIVGETVRWCKLRNMKDNDALVTALVDADERGLQAWGANVDTMGCTAITALISPCKITIANVGDSAAYLLRDNYVLPLSRKHTPAQLDERQRILRAGGTISKLTAEKIERVQGIMAVSRAIGDHNLRPYVTAEPEVTSTERLPNDILILASDGLWDVMRPEEALTTVRTLLNNTTNDPETIANLLVQQAIDRLSRDNITIIIAMM